MEQGCQPISKRSTGSCFETKLVGVVDALPTVFRFSHDIFMGEQVVAAGTAFQVAQRVIFAGVGFDNFEVIA